MLVRSALLSCLLLALPLTAARADDASRLAKAHEMLQITHSEEMINQMRDKVFQQIEGVMVQQLHGVQPTPPQQKVLHDFTLKVEAVISDTTAWKSLEPEYAKLYATTFTEDELDSILAFYRTPAGQAFIEKSPGLLKASIDISQQRMEAAMPKVRDLMQQYMKDITAASQPPASSTTPSPAPSTPPANQ